MNNKNYSKAFKEVYMILKSVGKKVQNKIPTNLLDFIEKNMDKNYFFMLDDSIPLEEQSFMDETLGIISLIWRDYLCSKEEKEKTRKQDKKNFTELQKLIEKERIEKYSPDNIFKNRKKEKIISKNNILKENAITEYKEQNFIQKLFEKIKHLFKRKN